MIEPGQKPMRSFYPLGRGPAARAGKTGSAALLFGYERARAWISIPHKKTKWESMRLLANGLAAARAGRTDFSVPSFGCGKANPAASKFCMAKQREKPRLPIDHI